MSEYKTCTKCKQEKPLDQFGKHSGKKSAKSGIRPACKQCEIDYAKAFAAANPEVIRERKRRYKERHPEKVSQWAKTHRAKHREKLDAYSRQYRLSNKEKIAEINRLYRLNNLELKKKKDAEWAKKNPDKVRESSRRYRLNNPEKAKQNGKRYRERNPERSRILRHRRRARINDLPLYKLPAKSIRRMLARDCAYCGNKSVHLDHTIPVARGGYTGIGNLTPACSSCNFSKNALYVMEWKLRRIKRGY